MDGDIESLSNRVKKAEHILYPAVIDALASGKLQLIEVISLLKFLIS